MPKYDTRNLRFYQSKINSPIFISGGAFGLWTGTSLFTVIEFIYFFGKKIRFVVSRQKIIPSSAEATSNYKVRHLPVIMEQPA